MIYLFVILLSVTTPDGKGWHDGQYSITTMKYTTIAQCETERNAAIRRAETHPITTLISRCAADDDVVTYHGYAKPDASPVRSRNGV